MTYSSAQLIRCEFPAEHVLLLAMNRPPVNAYSDQLARELQLHLETASSDPDVRVVVLSSDVEKGFTAGLDLFACVQRFGSSAGRKLGLIPT
jgi:enoyl-CoA hydratase/carnithine racemase